MNSRNGPQADQVGWGFSDPTPLKPTPNPVVTSLAVDKNDGVVKTKISCSVFVTPRVSQRRLRTKTLVSHAESPRVEQIAPPTIDSA